MERDDLAVGWFESVMSTGAGGSVPRGKRRALPACLQLGLGPSSTEAAAIRSSSPPPKRQARGHATLASDVRAARFVSVVHPAAPSTCTLSDPPRTRCDVVAESRRHVNANRPPTEDTHATSKGTSHEHVASRPPSSLMPVAFDAASRAPFRLLHLPADALSIVTAYLWIWDAFLLRCTCRAARLISGINGGESGPPMVSPPRDPHAAAAAAATHDEAGDEPLIDNHRFWHHYTSIDLRQILVGWRAFESERARLISRAQSTRLRQGETADGLICLRSPSPATSPRDDILALDSDEDDDQHVRYSGDSRLGAASTCGPHSAPDPLVDIYDRLQRVVTPFLAGCPRLRPSAARASHGAISSRREDVSTSEEEDSWLLRFFAAHRMPFVRHLHLAYATLAPSLTQHLQSFCCTIDTSRTDATGGVCEISAQYSEKTAPRAWIEAVCRSFGPLEIMSALPRRTPRTHACATPPPLTVSLSRAYVYFLRSLDLSSCPHSVWPALHRSLVSVGTAGTTSSLTRLSLLGPMSTEAALPGSVIELLAEVTPNMRHLFIAHGLRTTQAHLERAAAQIRSSARWRRLRTLTLAHFPQIVHLLPLLASFAGHATLRRLDVRECVNARLPIVEMPPKKQSTMSSNSTARAASHTTDMKSTTKTTKSSLDLTILESDAPRLPSLTTWSMPACASLTAPSLRSLATMMPRVDTIHLTAYDSRAMGGSALKILLDPASEKPRRTHRI